MLFLLKVIKKIYINDIKTEFDSDTNPEILYSKTFEENRGRLAWVLNNVSFLNQHDDWKRLGIGWYDT